MLHFSKRFIKRQTEALSNIIFEGKSWFNVSFYTLPWRTISGNYSWNSFTLFLRESSWYYTDLDFTNISAQIQYINKVNIRFRCTKNFIFFKKKNHGYWTWSYSWTHQLQSDTRLCATPGFTADVSKCFKATMSCLSFYEGLKPWSRNQYNFTWFIKLHQHTTG